jgi:hypothetical protein
MSRSTERRRTRHGALASLVAVLLAVVPALMTSSPAAAATWVISGTIGNWDASLDGSDVYVVLDDGSLDGLDVGDFQVSGPTFVWDSADAYDPTVLVDGRYTLYFDVDDASEFVDGFLGQRLDEEYPEVTWLDLDPLADVDAGTFDLIEAQYISGTVLGDGSPVEGALVYADDESIIFDADGDFVDWMQQPFVGVTDVDGAYRIKVAAGRSYVVTATHGDWPGQTYDGIDGCGCRPPPGYTPVQADPPPAGERTEVDFDFVRPAAFIFGYTADQFLSGPAAGVDVHLYRPVTGGWVEVDSVQSDGSGAWELSLVDDGAYRVRFSYLGAWAKIAGAAWALSSGPIVGPDAVDACFIDTEAIPEGEEFFLVAGLIDPVDDASCGAEPAPTSGGGGTAAPRPRSRAPISTGSATTIATPAPGPSPTPTATATPRPSSSPSPSATPAPTPASSSDLWWLLWVGLGLLVLVVIGGVVFFVRRA